MRGIRLEVSVVVTGSSTASDREEREASIEPATERAGLLTAVEQAQEVQAHARGTAGYGIVAIGNADTLTTFFFTAGSGRL